MSKGTTVHQSRGIGFIGLLQLLLIGLKLTGYIDWSWWWVWSPFLVGFGFATAMVVTALVVAAILGSR